MMRLGRRASLLVVFALLTSAATASAECAWVLWTEIEEKSLKAVPDPKYGKGDPTWKFDHNVHETRAACEAALSREMASTVRAPH